MSRTVGNIGKSRYAEYFTYIYEYVAHTEQSRVTACCDGLSLYSVLYELQFP
jgi:hypothetical protein